MLISDKYFTINNIVSPKSPEKSLERQILRGSVRAAKALGRGALYGCAIVTVGVVNFFRDEKIGAKGVTVHRVGGRAVWPEHAPIARVSPYHKIKRLLVEEETAEDIEYKQIKSDRIEERRQKRRESYDQLNNQHAYDRDLGGISELQQDIIIATRAAQSVSHIDQPEQLI